MKRSAPKDEKDEAAGKKNLCMFLIPCSCGASFAVTEDYDRRGMHLRSFIPVSYTHLTLPTIYSV